MNRLLTPITIGNLQLKNRIIMAPLTRCRAGLAHIPNQMMAEYYSQRATAGLIIAEATMIIEGNSAFIAEPGIYSKEQVAGWKNITNQVHQNGGHIFLQLWHGGRACHPDMNQGQQCVAPSAIAIEGDVRSLSGKTPHVTPRALGDDEIPSIVAGFKKAAFHALEAGFDGVEVHAANGYLLDQFLRDSSNHRGGAYGGSLENRAKLLFQVVDAVAATCGPDRVGVRISPLNSYNSMQDSDPVGLTYFVASHLQNRKIAYLHLMRGDFLGKQVADVVTPARKGFKGILIANMGYTPTEDHTAIEGGFIDAVAFGHHFISNPDLVACVQNNVPLFEPDVSTYYSSGPKGYTDYPKRT